MARLSKQAWNNVIIFSMLGMMLVLHSSDIFNSNNQPYRLIDDTDIILSLEFDRNVIERVGQTWRLNPESPAAGMPIEASRLAGLVERWQSITVENQTEVPEQATAVPEHVVVVWLAGEKEGRVYPLVEINGRGYVGVNGVAMRILSPTYNELSKW